MSEKIDETENGMGERIRLLRVSFKKTQKEVAEYLNISQQTYSRIERGKTPVDSAIVKQLCELYGVSADTLLGIKKREEPKAEPERMAFGGNEAEFELFYKAWIDYKKNEGEKQ